MKVKYFGALFAVLLSLGLVTSCADTGAGDGGVDAGGDATQVEPDAGVTDPDAEPVEPDAGGTQPAEPDAGQ